MKLSSEKYFGKTAINKRLNNFHLSLTTYYDPIPIPLHCHENPYLSVNLGCVYKEVNTTSERTIQSGEIILRPTHYEHKNIFSKGNGICFNLEIINLSNSEIAHLFQDVAIKPTGLEWYKLVVAFINNYPPDELECLIQETLLNDAEAVYSIRKPIWFKKIIAQIQEEYDTTLSLDYISKTVNLHPIYMARKFKQLSGLTIGEYIRKVRTEKAFNLLSSSQNSLTDVGLQAGFYDLPHFSKTFQTTFGQNPQNFRAALKRLI